MHLASLLAEARTARPHSRIELRDPIAEYGARAIGEVAPWIADPKLSAFAIRVVIRAGRNGDRETALRALRAARRHVPGANRADLEWAIGSLVPPKPKSAARRPKPMHTVVQSTPRRRRYGA